MAAGYQALYRKSLSDPEAFWSEAARAIDWHEPFEAATGPVSEATGLIRWFAGGQLNTCYNALDRHVLAGAADRVALRYESPATGTSEAITYGDLLRRVARFAGALRRLGLARGDRVVIYMPTTPEAIVAMLACARLGAVHSVVFGGFASHELATRIDDCKPRIIVASSCGIEPKGLIAYKPLLDEALRIATHEPDRVIIHQRAQLQATLISGRDISWDDAVAGAEDAACVMIDAGDPLYILYTSGTTGKPKGVVRDNGGHAVALTWTMQHLYGIMPGETFWAASDIGWAVGHSYMVYAPLFAGCTSLVYEGKPVGTPDAAIFWRLIARHEVCVLFTAPTAIRAIKREDPDGELTRSFNLPSLRALFLAGERSDGNTLDWAERNLGIPVVDHWWQTETGWPITANPIGVERFPSKHGSVCKPMPGWDVHVLDREEDVTGQGRIGRILLRLPLPPGSLKSLWNGDNRFRASYLSDDPGFYTTGDAGIVDADGDVFIMSRIDDVINVAGHRLSTAAMEEVLASHSEVSECAVVGVADDLKGQIPLGFLVLKQGSRQPPADVIAGAVALVRERIGPVAFFKQAVVVERLPKTRSGKVLRGTMKQIVDGQAWTIPPTIEDPAVMDEIAASLQLAGLLGQRST